jgi:hypothetical protein
LCGRQAQEGFGLRLDRWGFLATVMQVGRPELGHYETIGMGEIKGLIFPFGVFFPY